MTAGRGLVRALVLVVATAGLAGCGQAEPQLTGLPMAAPATDPAAQPSIASTSPPPATPSAAPSRPRPQSSVTRAPAGRQWSVEITFYGAQDNDPPGSTTISHPTVHRAAGGSGTYADPITLASDPREIPVGTRIYYPPQEMYFVMEDACAQCISDWGNERVPHIDLWAGDAAGDAFLACENALTPDGRVTVELDPPPGRPVDTRPLYGAGGCRV